MKIKDLFELVDGLPNYINVITDKEDHLYIGAYSKAPEEIKELKFTKAILNYDSWVIVDQILFYI
jgi:hypothetical protein